MTKEKLNLDSGYYIEKFIPEGRVNYRYDIRNPEGKLIGFIRLGKFYPTDEGAYTRQILREINLLLEEINGQKGVKRGELLAKNALKWNKKKNK